MVLTICLSICLVINILILIAVVTNNDDIIFDFIENTFSEFKEWFDNPKNSDLDKKTTIQMRINKFWNNFCK